MPHKIALRSSWKGSMTDTFNVIAVGDVFREQTKVIVVGCEDGAVRLYKLPNPSEKIDHHYLQPWKCLESKGGPIQTLALHDVTKFGSVDIISGDSRGTITIFSNGQILDHRHLSGHSVISLQVDEDLAGNMAIVAGDTDGLVSAVHPFTDLWSLKLRPEHSISKQPGASQPAVRSLLAFSAPSSPAGHVTNYVIASDDHNSLHILQQGTKVMTLSTPAPVTALCSGSFQGNSGEIDQRYSSIKEVALGCHNGSIYIMKEFKILAQPHASIQLPITHMRRIPSIHEDGLDSLLCTGHFRAVLLLHNGQILSRFEVSDLVVTMATWESDSGEDTECLIGCRDKTLYSLQVT